MISSPGNRQPPNSALILSGARGPGTLRAKVNPARLLFLDAPHDPRADNSNMHKASPASLWLAPAGALNCRGPALPQPFKTLLFRLRTYLAVSQANRLLRKHRRRA